MHSASKDTQWLYFSSESAKNLNIEFYSENYQPIREPSDHLTFKKIHFQSFYTYS